MKKVVVIGGGIAGTSCVEYILTHSTNIHVTLIAATDVIKTAVIGEAVTQICKHVDVEETSSIQYGQKYQNLEIIVGCVTLINAKEKFCELSDGKIYSYDKLCIATGAIPNSIDINNRNVMTLRDTDTAKKLIEKIKDSKKIVVVGNGGIALELVYEIDNCELVWCIKDNHIGSTFLDEGAATFLLKSLHQRHTSDNRKCDQLVFKRKRYNAERQFFKSKDTILSEKSTGSALGPDWCSAFKIKGNNLSVASHNVQIEYSCEVLSLYSKSNQDNSSKNSPLNSNVFVKLDNGKELRADIIISATGVKPNINFNLISDNPLKCNEDNYICVNNNMETNIDNIYAAGDICHATWDKARNWFQMKLWTQAYQFGSYTGKCIIDHFNDERSILDFCFEVFTHTTTFFGFKVILLGNYNFQNLNKDDCNILLRYTPDVEYVKLILLDGCVQGAVLIGETDLEETMENLIVNQINVDFLGESLLDPQVDIEDYFD